MKTPKLDSNLLTALALVAGFVFLLIFLAYSPTEKTGYESAEKITESSGNGDKNFDLKADTSIDGGDYSYKKISLDNTKLTVRNHKGLILRASEEIVVDKNSSIDLTGGGNIAKTAGAGLDYDYAGGGGSFAGNGGSGSCLEKITSSANFSANSKVELGTTGGTKKRLPEIASGGGFLMLVAPKIIIEGRIIANGSNGSEYMGGGSGGKIILVSDNISVTGSVSAEGGHGGDGKIQGAGGGGGGLIILNSKQKDRGNLSVAGGKGGKALDPYTGCNGDNGRSGKIFVGE